MVNVQIPPSQAVQRKMVVKLVPPEITSCGRACVCEQIYGSKPSRNNCVSLKTQRKLTHHMMSSQKDWTSLNFAVRAERVHGVMKRKSAINDATGPI